MVHSCCVNGCHSRSHNYKKQKLDNNLRFFQIPTWKRSSGQKIEELTKRRRMAWVAAIRRKDITFHTAPPHMCVCSRHFHKGQPAYEMMETDPDWAPSLQLGHTSVKPTDTSRAARRFARELLRKDTQGPGSSISSRTYEKAAPCQRSHSPVRGLSISKESVSDHQYAFDPVKGKLKLAESQEMVEKLRQDLRNSRDRERRQRERLESLMEHLKEKNSTREAEAGHSHALLKLNITTSSLCQKEKSQPVAVKEQFGCTTTTA